MSVPSKSKNAATSGPSGPAYTSASRSDNNTGDLRSVGRVEGLDDLRAVDEAVDVREVLTPPGEYVARVGSLAGWVEQPEVLLQVDGRREQLPGDRLGAVQPSLQQHRLAHAGALVEQRRPVDRLPRVGRRQAVGDDQLGVQEGPQHPVRHQYAGSHERRSRVQGLGCDQLDLLAQLGLEGVAVGEEELEL